jgi:hypothetical protein
MVGSAAVVAGVLVSLLGLGGLHAFDVAVKSFAFDSTSTGMAVVALGAALVAGVTLDEPDDVALRYGRSAPAAGTSRQPRTALAAVLAMAVGLFLFVASILF